MLGVFVLAASSSLAFVPGMAPHRHVGVSSSSNNAVVMMAKGFGKVEPKKEKKEKPKAKSVASVQRDQAAADLEKLKATGAPEYMVCVREAPEGGEKSKWYPVGGIAVPRSSSLDTALSLAIYQNEEDLLKGAVSSRPAPRSHTPSHTLTDFFWISLRRTLG